MKKQRRFLAVVLVFLLTVALSACGQGGQNEGSPAADTEGKTLIAYFSWSSSGNTEKMASSIQEQTGGDLLEIEPLNPYPEDYTECTEVAMERDNNERPGIANLPDTIEEYDKIFIGYTIWCIRLPWLLELS